MSKGRILVTGGNGRLGRAVLTALGARGVAGIRRRALGDDAVLIEGNGVVDPAALAGVTAIMGHVRAKRVVALAVTSPARSPIAPDIPTLAELGIRGVEAPSWYSIVAPAATPADVVARLHGEIVAIHAQPEYREPLERQAFDAVTTTPQEFAVFLRTEYDKWGKVIKALKLK